MPQNSTQPLFNGDEMDLLEKYPNAVEQVEILKTDYLGVN